MAKLVSPPQRFTPKEWVVSNQRKNASAEEERALAQRLIAESSRFFSGEQTLDVSMRLRDSRFIRVSVRLTVILSFRINTYV